MRESFTYGSVGRAPGNRCLYPEADAKTARLISSVKRIGEILCQILSQW